MLWSVGHKMVVSSIKISRDKNDVLCAAFLLLLLLLLCRRTEEKKKVWRKESRNWFFSEINLYLVRVMAKTWSCWDDAWRPTLSKVQLLEEWRLEDGMEKEQRDQHYMTSSRHAVVHKETGWQNSFKKRHLVSATTKLRASLSLSKVAFINDVTNY